MNKDLLLKIGLTESQAKAYLALVKSGRLTPPQLAKAIKESRTAAYMALGKLEEIGLAEKVKGVKKQTFAPTSPSALNKYIEAKKRELTEVEDEYRAGLSDMLAYYYSQQRQAGMQYFQGEVGLQEMYKDIVRTGKDVHLLRTYADEDYFGDWLYDFMDQRAKAGIKTHALLPFNLGSFSWAKKNNKRLNRESAWYPREAYKAPVEISAYGDKVAIISFGEEATGTILESPQIAQAFRELLGMARVGAQELLKAPQASAEKM
ncbi:MAG: transcriptional regulator TrmB [Candidatus Saccharibacteria bacterium]|jgi:sugar-specific transcriptional regulator TrmB|nr:transcriptional regulator TrmB [Candidatus Saccharibacteria bacterium]